MRILSVKLPLIENVELENFYSVIVKWLEKKNNSKNLCEKFKKSQNKTNINLCDGNFMLETFDGIINAIKYVCLNLSHKCDEQHWTTEVIYENNNDVKSVIIHINCSGSIIKFENVPNSRSEIIREFIDSSLIKQGKLFIQRKPIYTDNNNIDLLAGIIDGKENLNLPLIYISRINGVMGQEVDVEKLAERLAGIAYVIDEKSEEFSFELKEKTNKKNPFNGYVGIYYSNKGKILRNNQGNQLEKEIAEEVVRLVNAQTDSNSITVDKIKETKTKEESKENKDLYNGISDENDSLRKQLKDAVEKIKNLTEEKMLLCQKNECLQNAMNSSGIKESLLDKVPIKEFFDGEQHDLIVTILKKAAQNCGGFDTRQNELINELLKNFDYIGNGKIVNEVVKRVLSSAEPLSAKDWKELEKVGFKLVSDNNHYKVVYKENERYWFTISKSSSDIKSGKNNASDIIRRLSVYQ